MRLLRFSHNMMPNHYRTLIALLCGWDLSDLRRNGGNLRAYQLLGLVKASDS
jgi:hypothetical protein